jgi:hypothetical protein
VEDKMKVGDLVKHRNSGAWGIVTQLRTNHWQTDVGMAKVFWIEDDVAILHTIGQLESV